MAYYLEFVTLLKRLVYLSIMEYLSLRWAMPAVPWAWVWLWPEANDIRKNLRAGGGPKGMRNHIFFKNDFETYVSLIQVGFRE